MRPIIVMLMLVALLGLASCRASFDMTPPNPQAHRENTYPLENRVDLREAAGIDAPIIMAVERGTMVTVLSWSDDHAWVNVEHRTWDDKYIQGWVPAAALDME